MEVMSMDFVHPTEELLEEYCFRRVQEPTLSVLEEHLLVCEVCRAEVEGLDLYIGRLKSALRPASSTPVCPVVSGKTQRWLEPKPRLILPRLVGVAFVGVVLLAAGAWVWQKLPTRPGSTQMASLHTSVVDLKALRGGLDFAPIIGKQSTFANEGPKDGARPKAAETPDGVFNRARAGEPLELRVEQATLSNLAISNPSTSSPSTSKLANPNLADENRAGPRLQVVDTLGHDVWSGEARVGNGYWSARIPQPLRAGRYWVRLYSASNELVREFALRLD
jgi:hypothetical protein